jgi:hypothetical protein
MAEADVEQHRRTTGKEEVDDLVVAVDVVEEGEDVAPDREVHPELEDQIERPLHVEHARGEHDQEAPDQLAGVRGVAHDQRHDRADQRSQAQHVERVADDPVPIPDKPLRKIRRHRLRANHYAAPERRRPLARRVADACHEGQPYARRAARRKAASILPAGVVGSALLTSHAQGFALGCSGS